MRMRAQIQKWYQPIKPHQTHIMGKEIHFVPARIAAQLSLMTFLFQQERNKMKTPLKVRIEILENKNGVYYFSGQLFTGIAFQSNEHKELSSFLIKGGHMIGNNYSPAYFGYRHTGIELDITDYVYDDIYGSQGYVVKHREQHYTGLAYYFDYESGICESEFIFLDGNIACESCEDIEQTITSLWLTTNDQKEQEFCENYQWLGDEKIVLISITRDFCDIAYNEDGLVCRFSFGENFSDEKTKHFFAWPYSNLLNEIVFSETVSFAKKEITVELINHFLKNGALKNTKSIRFFRTSIPKEFATMLKSKYNIDTTFAL